MSPQAALGRGIVGDMRMIDALADLLLGSACPGCSVPRWGVCPGCRAEVSDPRVWTYPDGLPVVGLTDYEGVGGRLVRALKDGGAWTVAPVCGPGLSAGLDLIAGRGIALVPAPSSAEAVRRRGFHHSLALAKASARQGDSVVDALRRVRQVEDQAGLDHTRRLTNQSGSMSASAPDRAGTAAVIVDDVCTTGATLLAARQALVSRGWTVLGAVVVTVTAKRRESL